MKERDSNIELLRIVATFMILVVHCNGWFLRDWGGITTWSAGQGWLVGVSRALIQSLSCIGVNCFVLISGFFSIKPKFKSVINLYSILLFFYLLCYGLSVYVGDSLFSWRKLGNCFFAFSAGGNWFVQSYLILMLLSPILNAFVERCNEKTLSVYILTYMALMYYFSAVWNAEKFLFAHGYSFTTFICLYLIGRYVRIYGLVRASNYPKWSVWIAFAGSIVLMTFFHFVCNNEGRWLSYESPFLIVSATLLLVCFAQLNISSKFVNWIAPSCLAVFIFHTSSPVIDWLARKDVRWFTTQPFHLYLLRIGGAIIAVYIFATLLDILRRYMLAPILKIADKNSSRHEK